MLRDRLGYGPKSDLLLSNLLIRALGPLRGCCATLFEDATRPLGYGPKSDLLLSNFLIRALGPLRECCAPERKNYIMRAPIKATKFCEINCKFFHNFQFASECMDPSVPVKKLEILDMYVLSYLTGALQIPVGIEIDAFLVYP